MGLPATVRAFIAGSSGSGKSTAAWRFYLQNFPRRILLDPTGEWGGNSDATVYNVQELSLQMRRLAPRGRWTISVALDGEDDIEELVDYLIPVPHLERSPIRQMGGAVLLVDEVDLIAPPHTARREIRTLWRRSRHVGLSVVATTQRPESVSREVTAQSQHVLCLQLVEPAALEYMAKIMRVDLSALPAWWNANPHGGLWRDVLAGRSLWLSEDGKLRPPSKPAELNDPDRQRRLPGGVRGIAEATAELEDTDEDEDLDEDETETEGFV